VSAAVLQPTNVTMQPIVADVARMWPSSARRHCKAVVAASWWRRPSSTWQAASGRPGRRCSVPLGMSRPWSAVAT
jgi:hypothetical protein